VEEVLAGSFLNELPARLIGDRAYDSDALDQRLKEEYDIGLIAPHRWATKSANAGWPEVAALQQTSGPGAAVWMAELVPWVGHSPEHHIENFLGMVRLACITLFLGYGLDLESTPLD
jgi:hypothetical protein